MSRTEMQNHCNASVISPPRTPGGNRTHGHLDLRQAALPLAYGGIAGRARFERAPTTSKVSRPTN